MITFYNDAEAGLVEAYVKENGYTFPVLLAHDFVSRLLGEYGIPQNWIIDSKGKRIATQSGFDAADRDWMNTMLRKLEAARQSGQ